MVPWGRWEDGTGVSEVPEVAWGRWEGAQEKNVKCRDPRGIWSSLLAQFEGTPGQEVVKGSAGLSNFTAVPLLLQIKGV